MDRKIFSVCFTNILSLPLNKANTTLYRRIEEKRMHTYFKSLEELGL